MKLKNNIEIIKRKIHFGFIFNILLSFVYTLYYVTKYIHYILLFKALEKKIENKRIDILYSSFLRNWRNYTYNNRNVYEFDLMIGDIIENTILNYNVMCIDRDSGSIFRDRKRTYSKFQSSGEWICIEQFMRIKDIFRAFIFSLKYSFGYNIEENLEIYFSIIDQEVNVNTLMKLLISENILSVLQPRMLFLTCEYCHFQKELAYVAHTKKIPVVALQHGLITEEHPGYMFTDKRRKVLLPDITCVFGQNHYDLLTKNSIYDSKMVVITGSPRYDILVHAEKLYSRERFVAKCDIKPENKIVLWTTQCHGISDEENKKNFIMMFETLQCIKDVTLIIKQHPGEGKKYTKMIEDALKGYNLNIVIPPKSSDTYEQIYVCDIMITKNSTTAMEAVVLDKPVIVLNLSGEPDAVGYVAEGVALGVYDENDLKPTIEKLLKDDSELAENRKEYIKKYLYKIDGKSTERVVQLIEKTLE